MYIVVSTKPNGEMIQHHAADWLDAQEMVVEMLTLITMFNPDVEEDPSNVAEPTGPDMLVLLQCNGDPCGSIYAYPKGVN